MNVFKFAKEISFKKNDDGTFQMNVKMDMLDSNNNVIKDANLTYGRVDINAFDYEILEIPYNHELFKLAIDIL